MYEHLRAAIIHGDIRPNERLVEVVLAAQLNASRTPVREALQRLAGEGLVSTLPSGWVAREHTVEDIRDIYETRLALEGFASRLAAQRATPEQLDAIIAAHRVNDFQPPYHRLADVNDDFHDAITLACGNPRLINLCRRNRQYFFNRHIAALYTAEEARTALDGHERIVQAIVDHDAAAAEAITREHILEGLEVLLSKPIYSTRRSTHDN